MSTARGVCPAGLDDDIAEVEVVVMRRFASQEEAMSRLQADVDELRELVHRSREQLLSFSDTLAAASGFVRQEAELLAERLR